MAPPDQQRDPSLAEWTCLGILYDQPAHGWAIVKQLRRDGEIGHIWHLSRPLTYRALDQLSDRGWVVPVAREPGVAGPNRTILSVTQAGRSQLRQWVQTPVPHRRDLRTELLLKLVFAERHSIDITGMLDQQRALIATQLAELAADPGTDHAVVVQWRTEMTRAAQRFLDLIQLG